MRVSYKHKITFIKYSRFLFIILTGFLPLTPLLLIIGLPPIPATFTTTSFDFYKSVLTVSVSSIVGIFCGFATTYSFYDYKKTRERWIQEGKIK